METKDRGWVEEVDRESRIAMESGTFSRPLYNDLKERGFDVLMAHPAKLRLIAESFRKTDSFHLANLLRMEYPPYSWVPDRKWEEIRNVCRRRVSLKITRTKNEIHALRNGIELNHSLELLD